MSAHNITLIVLVYDSIENSVFQSQVLAPLGRYYKTFYTKIIVYSFEQRDCTTYAQELSTIWGIEIVCYRRLPYCGIWSLLPCIFFIKRIVKKLHEYHILARGPQAGCIAYYAQTINCTQSSVQARGLLAEEYGYVHQKACGIRALLHAVRAHMYTMLEYFVYTRMSCIEVVSDALGEYLMACYDIPSDNIKRALYDIPQPLDRFALHALRKVMRNYLNIADNVYVYGYHGSVHTWQCIDQVLLFFKKEWLRMQNDYQCDEHVCMLVLVVHVRDETYIRALLKVHMVPMDIVRILSCPPHALNSCLAVIDCGIVMRMAHIINWVARPTKYVDYQALGIPVVHNGTVDYILQHNMSYGE